MFKKGFGNYQVITHENLHENKGIRHAYQIIEMKGLMGDSADNIPGCPGVGAKTAVKLIDQYGTINHVYDHIDEQKGKLKERLIEHKEQVYLSYDLAKIRTDIEVDCPLESCELQLNREKVLNKIEELEFSKNLIKSIIAS
jgi:DNA polymerase-1